MQLLEHDDGATQVLSILIQRSPIVSTIVLDPQSVKRFSEVCGQTEIRDESGRLCGLFFPAPASPPYEPSFTREELDRAAAEPGGRSLAEILADLEARS